ncbi:unnamed protein product [Toxocara canis]|uniref:WD_REPEATS_REGION domain-containing protein n=1 Tax=Toxocara canis TaxID=6265 RepID=A0A183V9A4_TOXCA|nr:unnamed protein product [Toxocara canis]
MVEYERRNCCIRREEERFQWHVPKFNLDIEDLGVDSRSLFPLFPFQFFEVIHFLSLACGASGYTYYAAGPNGGAKGLEQCKFETTLYGHESALCTISVCSEYAVAVSGCSEGKVCLWDSNRLSFVRTLVTPGSEAAKLTCISSVTCDVAVVFQSGYGSRVCLYTVNGDRVGCLETDITVTALGMTSLPEGTAVNCLALEVKLHCSLIDSIKKTDAVSLSQSFVMVNQKF